MMDVHSLVPKTKGDLETADAAIAAGYPTVEPILFDLITWLQDYNWPVALRLSGFLRSIGAPLAPHISRILQTDDLVWKYWVIEILVTALPVESAMQFRPELERIGYEPTDVERQEELDVQARDVLQHFGWQRSDG